MKYSHLFAKTSKDIPSDEKSKNAKLLIQAGFVDKTMAGVYAMLPLGLRVLNKIENIIRKHLDIVGSQEILMNSLHPKANWEKTNRWDTVDILFKLESQTETPYALACSHEEQVTPILKNFISSFKSLPDYDPEKKQFPVSVYQIQTKFRDELRAKSGLLRGREFRMKDAYDFHKNQESLDKYYDKMKQTYFDIYDELGLEVYAVQASGGIFTQNTSHEFQTPCEAGEDEILYSPSTGFSANVEIMEDLEKKNQEIPADTQKIKVAEVGNIFKLGEKYTKSFDFKFTDQNNKLVYPVMGCHGIGTTRCMAVIAENYSDEKGLKWPSSVAPFQYHLISQINPKDDSEINQKIQTTAQKLYNQLNSGKLKFDLESKQFENTGVKTEFETSGLKKQDCLWDDRENTRLGGKLKDADLIGCPVQIIVTKRTVENDQVEVIIRKNGKSLKMGFG